MNRWHRRFLGVTTLPSELTDFELKYFFTLSDADRQAVNSRYKANPRIGAAIQLGFLRLSGCPLRAFKVLPARLLAYIGEQLDLPAPTIASLRAIYRRRSTLYEHQHWAIAAAGFSRFDHSARSSLRDFLATEAVSAAALDDLIQSSREWLYERRILIPAGSTLRDLALATEAKAAQFQYEAVVDLVQQMLNG